MKSSSILYPLLSAILITSTSVYAKQNPLMDNLGPAVPPVNPDQPSSGAPGGDVVILCDVLGRDRSINIFAGFTRDIDTVDKRLSDETLNTTVLAPLNSAIMALPRKPWQDPEDYKVLGPDAYEGESGEDRAHQNLRRFVENHVVPVSPWAEGEKVATMAGGEVWWVNKDGKKMIQPGNLEVTTVASQVANGQVWILNAARNYA